MTYEPHEWQVGDKITSARLNNMEQGIAAANSSIITLPMQEFNGEKTLNASYDDIIGFLAEGKMIFVIDGTIDPNYTKIMPVLGYGYNNSLGKYEIEALDYQLIDQNNHTQMFGADSRTDPLSFFTMPK